MNQDDDTLLSAYLDGELDATERLAVESALLSDPRAAERLRALAVVRDLVAGLPRPRMTVDLAPAVTRQVARDRPGVIPFGAGTRSQPRAVGVGLAAACLFLAVTLSVGLSLARRPKPNARPDLAQGPSAVPNRVANSPRVPRPLAAAPRSSASIQPATPAARSETGAVAHAREQTEFRRMLDSPHLRKVFVVTDVIGGHARDRVGGLIENAPRVEPRFGRAVVSQGIVIDPNHPGEATVFALVMTDQEFSQFRTEISQTFPGQVEETDPDPSVVTQLADVGQVAIVPGVAVATLEPGDPSRTIEALRATQGETPDDAKPTPEQERSAPARYVERRAEHPPAPAAGPAREVAALDRPNRRGSSVVLVWVTTR